MINTGKTLLQVYLKLPFKGITLINMQMGQNHKLCALRKRTDTFKYVIDSMSFHFNAAYWRICAANPCKQHTEIIVYLGACTDSGARISRVNLLFDGNRRRKSFYIVKVRLVHTSKKLACISRETFHIAALSFSIKRVESQRRFA